MKKNNIEFFKGNDGQYYFNILGNNGEVISTSEGYTRLWSAKRGAKAVTKVLINAEMVERIYQEGFKAGQEAAAKIVRDPNSDPRDGY